MDTLWQRCKLDLASESLLIRKHVALKVDKLEWCAQTAWTVSIAPTSYRVFSLDRSVIFKWPKWSLDKSRLVQPSSASLISQWSRISEMRGRTTQISCRCCIRAHLHSKLISHARVNAPWWVQPRMASIPWSAITSTTSLMDTIMTAWTCLKGKSQHSKSWTIVASCLRSPGLLSQCSVLFLQQVSSWNRPSRTQNKVKC